MVPIVRVVRARRDPRDDKFLEVAGNGRTDLMITGDRDPLELDPFKGIAILGPAAYHRSMAGATKRRWRPTYDVASLNSAKRSLPSGSRPGTMWSR
jgi:hypothetical protein